MHHHLQFRREIIGYYGFQVLKYLI
jgi:hypothetical protein